MTSAWCPSKGCSAEPWDPNGGAPDGVAVIGRADPGDVAKVVVTIGTVTVTPPLFRNGDEPVAYWPVQVPVKGIAEATSLPAIHYTYYDASGKAVASGALDWLASVPSQPAPTK